MADEQWDEKLGRTADRNEMAAVTSWVAAMEPAVVTEFGVRLERVGGALALFVPATGTAFFNRVMGLGVSLPATRPVVRMLVEEYRRLGTAFMIHLAPYAQPSELPRWLADEGLEPTINWLVVRRGPQPVASRTAPSPVVVRTVGAADAEVFAETLCTGYGMPAEWAPLYRGFVTREPWQHFLAWQDGRAVGTSSLFRNGSHAWLGNSATLPRYRKGGVQTTLNGERLRHGLAARCTAFTGETWEPTGQQVNQSLRNHQRDGWSTVYVRRNQAASPFGPEPK